MKYYVVVDARGYVLNITHTGTIRDYVELNLDEYDLSKKRAYKLGKNALIFDSDEWDRIVAEEQKKADEKEIASLQSFLLETSNYPMRAWEEIMALSNPITWVADVIKITVKYSREYRTILAQRVKAWKRIEELGGR
jgi:hypothetical protein